MRICGVKLYVPDVPFGDLATKNKGKPWFGKSFKTRRSHLTVSILRLWHPAATRRNYSCQSYAVS